MENQENKVLDEMEMRDLLRDKRKKIETLDDLIEFLTYVKDNCNYDYGVAPRSIAQASLATAWYFSNIFGITGFQAGFIMWDFIRDWKYQNNKLGLKIINYDDLLYPQYEDHFDKIMTKPMFEDLQKVAMEKLEKGENVAPEVRIHWMRIVNGLVPFGFKVVEGEE